MKELMVNEMKNSMGKKIVAKLLTRIALEKSKKQKGQGYRNEHDQEHHDDWTWNDH